MGAYRSRAALLILSLAVANAMAWAWALIVFQGQPVLLGTALLAYSLGLRHAFDADHIAAIDNVTRTLMQARQRPLGVGLFFSLGHSTVVVAATLGIAVAGVAFSDQFEHLRSVGALVGTLVSALFLVGIAIVNLVIFASIYRTLARIRRGETVSGAAIDALLPGNGLLTRLLRPALRLVRRSWHVYPLGLLFGLGFDTATEIGLLGISATSAGNGLPLGAILVFPALFTAGMTLMDTIDSVLMVGAYGWAFAKPIRKLYYNLTITALSVMVALLVGSVEVLGLIADRLHTEGPFWMLVSSLNDNMGVIGLGIVVLFLSLWLVSASRARRAGAEP